jgi:hypothetical protein
MVGGSLKDIRRFTEFISEWNAMKVRRQSCLDVDPERISAINWIFQDLQYREREYVSAT